MQCVKVSKIRKKKKKNTKLKRAEEDVKKKITMRLGQRSKSEAGNHTEFPSSFFSYFCRSLGPLGLGLSSDIRERINFAAPGTKTAARRGKIKINY